MNIQGIALDLDRTTLDREGHLSPENRQALEKAIGQGVHIIIASGRSFGALPQEVTSIPGIEYAITSNGAAVYHVPTGRCLRRYLLDPEAVEQVLQITAGEPVSYEGFIEGEAFASADYIRNPVKYGATPKAVAYIQHTRRLEEDIVGFLRQHPAELESMDVIVADREIRDRLMDKLRTKISDVYITSSVVQLIEISHRDGGKHNGVRFVLEQLGLSPENLAAFGDGDNDAEMLALAGCGIAVENATEACKAAADHVTLSHQENGVAYGMRRFLGLDC